METILGGGNALVPVDGLLLPAGFSVAGVPKPYYFGRWHHHLYDDQYSDENASTCSSGRGSSDLHALIWPACVEFSAWRPEQPIGVLLPLTPLPESILAQHPLIGWETRSDREFGPGCPVLHLSYPLLPEIKWKVATLPLFEYDP